MTASDLRRLSAWNARGRETMRNGLLWNKIASDQGKTLWRYKPCDMAVVTSAGRIIHMAEVVMWRGKLTA